MINSSSVRFVGCFFVHSLIALALMMIFYCCFFYVVFILAALVLYLYDIDFYLVICSFAVGGFVIDGRLLFC